MKKENVSQIISNIDNKYTDEATLFAINNRTKPISRNSVIIKRPITQPRRIRWGVLAACLVMFIVLGSAVTAFAVEAKEYKNAVTFFEENGLSTEGLSRSEIKAVYRDITTKSFTNEKTAEVLQQAVPGWEIEQDEPTPVELAALWDNWGKNDLISTIEQNGASYRFDSRYAYDEERGFEIFEKSVLECYQNGNMLWNAEFTDFNIEGYLYTKSGITVWGSDAVLPSEVESSYTKDENTTEKNEVVSSSGDSTYGWIAFVDNTGKAMWQNRLNHSFKNEYVASVLNNGDGTLAVISRGDLKYLCLSCYDTNGKELSFHKTEVGNFGIRNAARLGDWYIVQLWNQFSGDTALLYKMDRDGVLTDNFSYEDDNSDYYITDMVEFEGQVYLSAYAVPKQKDEGGRHEIANVLDYVFSKGAGGVDITSEELTPIVRGNYTALLLLCDPEGGTPKTFYSVKGSLGGKLSTNESGQLKWNVESISSTFYSPATNMFTIGGNCKVFQYSFDALGNLIEQIDTGETVRYAR